MESRTVKIFSKDETPRLQYIAGIIIGDILGLPFEIVTDRRKLGKFQVINYTDEVIPGSFKISPDKLLFERGIFPIKIEVMEWKGLPVFFPASADSEFPFDIFAASFFLVSRYEEYLEFEPDKHGRFPASSSVAFKNGFLGKPVVDLWVKELALCLVKKFNKLAFKRNEYKALLTLDIDQPFAYLGKGFLRSLGGMIRDIANNPANAGDRYRIIARGENDPFEIFDYLFNLIDSNNTEAKFFLPVGDHSEFDKNPSWKNDDYRSLIKRIIEKFDAGIHPSYYAAGDQSRLRSEVTRLRTIAGREITKSRFHYIKLFMPQSYNNILNSGITEDFSMGYPDEPGFRAGIARPFYFYDVADDMQTELKIYPFQVMDSTLFYYKNLKPTAARDIILDIIGETRKAGGMFICIWHNTCLQDNEEWHEWREMFEVILKTMVP